MAKNIVDAVREVCLSFPEAEERPGRGMPDFRVRDKTFATLAVNHHGDGRLALWLNSPPGAQQMHVSGEPELYFVPQYVGPRGWLGVHLDRGNDWRTVAIRVREAYEKVAPRALTRDMGATIAIEPPTETIDPEDFDPLVAASAQAILGRLRELVAKLPETTEASQFGNPAWKAGRKTFLSVHRRRKRMKLELWVGPDLQATLVGDQLEDQLEDQRFVIPRYIGHRGWIEVDVEERIDWDEVASLILGSYRHFALKRMLKVLDS